METYLDRILTTHRQATKYDDRSVDSLVSAASATRKPYDFAGALRESPGLSVIAEVKRRSPMKGELATGVLPSALARAYERGGASCVSVLTDQFFFGGLMADLGEVRAVCPLPLLRKDFIVSPQAVCDTRLANADAVLLIVAALSDEELRRFHALANELELTALIEVHDERELERALAVEPRVIGVNQRDLVTFEVDPDRAEKLAPMIPAGIVKVAESGITGPEDAAYLSGVGYDAVLVGESLVTSADPEAATRALLEAGAR